MLLFVLPLCVVFIFPSVITYYGREYVSVEHVLRTQLRFPETLFSFAYNGSTFYEYKKKLVEATNPKVITLGSSRVMQFREEFFDPASSFINAGGAGKSLEDIENFVGALSSTSSINVIILGLDKEIFESPYRSLETGKDRWLPVRFIGVAVSMSRRIYLDYLAHKYTLRDLYDTSIHTKHVGLSALVHQNGFRKDGSYRYGGASVNSSRIAYVKSEVAGRANAIESNVGIVNDKKIVIEQNIQALNRILADAKQKKIIVLGIMPPYPTPIYNAMDKSDDSFKFISGEICKSFRDANFLFFDLSSIKTFGGKETEFVDAIHGTDAMHLKIMIYLIEETSILDNYTDIKSLKDMLKKTKGDFLTF